MATPFISEISIVSFGYAPKGYAMCNGQLLPINQNQALFSLLGTTFGGDGRVNFGLPDFRGRVPVHTGNGHTLGERAGKTNETLVFSNMPDHTHNIVATLTQPTGDAATITDPKNAFPAAAAAGSPRYNSQADEQMAVLQAFDLPIVIPDDGDPVTPPQVNGPVITENNVSGQQAFTNEMPYLVLNFIIALQGVFPSTN
jgi:microcystin-dependent protein